jgi:hypothetical protein
MSSQMGKSQGGRNAAVLGPLMVEKRLLVGRRRGRGTERDKGLPLVCGGDGTATGIGLVWVLETVAWERAGDCDFGCCCLLRASLPEGRVDMVGEDIGSCLEETRKGSELDEILIGLRGLSACEDLI